MLRMTNSFLLLTLCSLCHRYANNRAFYFPLKFQRLIRKPWGAIKERHLLTQETADRLLTIGNKNKLAEARGILSDHFQLESVNIDRREQQIWDLFVHVREVTTWMLFLLSQTYFLSLLLVPELQGTSQEIASEKCRQAAKIVCFKVDGPTWTIGGGQNPTLSRGKALTLTFDFLL